MNWFVDKLGPSPNVRGAPQGGSPVDAKTGQPVSAPPQPQRAPQAAAPPQPAPQAAAPRPAAPPPAPPPEPEKKKKKGWF
ncbi:MAG TPA: hypothetical protein PLK37_15775 [Terricaulis sp.]|nr:hypothetical protein [Terricaulis sp.]